MNDIIKYFPFLAGVGIAASFWQQTKHGVVSAFHVLWKARQVPCWATEAVYTDLLDRSTVLPLDNYRTGTTHYAYSGVDREWVPVVCREFHTQVLLYRGCVPVVVSMDTTNRLVVQYLVGTFNFSALASRAQRAFTAKRRAASAGKGPRNSRFAVADLRGASRKAMGAAMRSQSLGTIPQASAGSAETTQKERPPLASLWLVFERRMPHLFDVDWETYAITRPSVMAKDRYCFTAQGRACLAQVEKWVAAEMWYTERNIPYKRGCLLYGAPGTGKSSLVREVARRTGLPVFVLHLATFDDEEFDRVLQDTTPDPAILLVEDIDTVWDGRKNVQPDGLSFDLFINRMSGVKSVNAKFWFVTTNHIDRLDPAMLRDGRLDEKVELTPLTHEDRVTVARVLLGEDLAERMAAEGVSDTTAEFENRCIRLALDNLWQASHE